MDELKSCAVAASHLETLLRPQTNGGDNDEDLEVIDVIAVPGLDDTWPSEAGDAQELIRGFFGDQTSRVRLSVYRYNPVVSLARILILNGIRREAFRLVSAVVGVRAADVKRAPIVFLASDLGATIVKQALIISSLDESTTRKEVHLSTRQDVFLPTRSIVSFGASHRAGPDQETRDVFNRLAQQANQPERPESHNLGLGLALAQAVAEINFFFVESKVHFSAAIIDVWSVDKEEGQGDCTPDTSPARLTVTSSASHSKLIRDGGVQKSVRQALKESLSLTATPLQDRSDMLQVAYHLVSGHTLIRPRHGGTQPRLETIIDNPDFNAWRSGLDRSILYVSVPDAHLAGPVAAGISEKLRTNSSTSSHVTEFCYWNRRYDSVESMLLRFLLSRAHAVDQSPCPGPEPIDGSAWGWTLDVIFRRVHTALLHDYTQDETTIWILVNLNERIDSYHWLMEKVGVLLADSDIRLQVLVVNTDGPPPTLTFPSIITIDTQNAQGNPAGPDGKAAESLKRNAVDSTETMENSMEGQFPASSRPEPLADEVEWLLANNPRLYPISQALNQVFINCGDDLDLRSIISVWFHSISNQVSVPELEKTAASLSPFSPSLVFQRILEYMDSESGEQARWTLESVLHSVRPLSVFEVQDFDKILPGRSGALGIPQLQISIYGATIPSLHGLVTIFDHEIQFGHPELREYLLAQQDNSPLAFGRADRAAHAHSRLTIACLEYLESAESRGLLGDHTNKPTLPESSVSFESSASFLWYAVKYWAEHAKRAGGVLSEQKCYFEKLVERPTLGLWAYEHWRLSPPVIRPSRREVTPITTLAGYGLGFVIDLIDNSRQEELADVEITQALRQAIKAGEVEVVRKLRLLQSLDKLVPLEVATASLGSLNETWILELFRLESREEDAPAQMSSAFKKATRLGLVAVMTAFLPHLPSGFEWNQCIRSACESGNCRALEVVYDAMLARNRSATVDEYDNRKDCQCLMDALLLACKYGQAEIVAFLAARKCALPSVDGEAIDDSHTASWVQTLETALVRATEFGQAKTLEALLNSEPNLSKTHPDTLKYCLGRATSRARLRCTTCLFEYLKNHTPEEELQQIAQSQLETAADTCHAPLFKLVLQLSGDRLESDRLRDLWRAANVKGDQSIQLLELLPIDDKTVWSDDHRSAYLGEALCDAAAAGSNKLASFLLKRGADASYINPGDGFDSNPLTLAVSRGNQELVEELIEAGADVNSRLKLQFLDDNESDGVRYETWPPAVLALHYPAILRNVIKAGAKINVEFEAGGRSGVTLLHYALWSHHTLESARILVENKCDVDIYTERRTELSEAVFLGDADIVQLLLDAGANPARHPSKDLCNPLLHICVNSDRPDIMKMLLLHDIPINDPDEEGDGPLDWISSKTTPEVVKLLVNRGASVNMWRQGGLTPLSRAVQQANPEVVKYLVSVRADVNFRGRSGTPLHMGCVLEDPTAPELVQFLVDSGADVNRPDKDIWGTPFQATIQRSRDDQATTTIIRQLLDNKKFDPNGESPWWGANINAACLTMDLEIVQELIKRGAKIRVTDTAGREPIHFAAYRTSEYLKYLEEEGACLGAKDFMGRTLLHVGVLSGRLDVVEYIIKKRPGFVNEHDANGWTPLLWAVCVCDGWGVDTSDEGRADIIRKLLSHGANLLVEAQGHDRIWTAFKLAVYHGLSDDIVELVTPSKEELERLKPHERDGWRHASRFSQNKKGRKGKAYLYSGFCDICLATLTGRYYYCDTCDNTFCLCFRCYPLQNSIHPSHDFRQVGHKEYDDDADDSSDDGGRSDSRRPSSGDGDEEGDEDQETEAEDDGNSGEGGEIGQDAEEPEESDYNSNSSERSA